MRRLLVASALAAACVAAVSVATAAAAAAAGTAAHAHAHARVPRADSRLRVPHGDLRAYMHGIGAASDGHGGTYVFFSSSGLPPRGAGRDGNWTHDVYVAHWTPEMAKLSKPRVFIRRPEAQEPVSIAQSSAGNIMVTFEDGWNTPDEVSQRYGVYSRLLGPVRPYPIDVKAGGHSGHAAAVGSRFVVFYSDDWVDGGGVDNLGTGRGVYVKTYDANGTLRNFVPVAPYVREWWPMIAGSPKRALLVWQQYVNGQTYAQLKVAAFDPVDGTLGETRVIAPHLQYYTYAAAYVPALDRFVVAASDASGHGFAQLIDEDGAPVATLACMPSTVREAGIAVIGERAFTPSQDGRLLELQMSASSIELAATQPSPIKWWYMGSLGLVRSDSRLHWVSLSPAGLQEADFDLAAARPATAADRCQP
ncbi:hypothetical protein [Trinickia mobilis]|uniref:hypothetical protein n=1 Tax=Trinickia mobilis TaxID=2816356 RepID=UPI001F5D4113|nr:hypothetical protein [Trinickia mobilis]